jgi:hypothetical protein
MRAARSSHAFAKTANAWGTLSYLGAPGDLVGWTEIKIKGNVKGRRRGRPLSTYNCSRSACCP